MKYGIPYQGSKSKIAPWEGAEEVRLLAREHRW